MNEYQGDEDDELQRILEGRDEAIESQLAKKKSSEPARKKRRVEPDEPVPEREEYDLDDFIVRHPYDDPYVDDDDEEKGDGDGKDEAQEAPVKKTVKRVILNPRPKLDPDRLKSQRGLAALIGQNENIPIKGPGHEADDLNKVMFALELWGHRLFPKLNFDDIIEKLEQLGAKKQVSVFVKKMRQGLPLDILKESGDAFDDEEDDDVERGFNLSPAEGPAVSAEQAFDRVFGDDTSSSNELPIPAQKEQVTLTDEQRQEIARKRLEALERRKLREAEKEQETTSNDEARAVQSNDQEPQDRVGEQEVTQQTTQDTCSQELMDMLADAEIE